MRISKSLTKTKDKKKPNFGPGYCLIPGRNLSAGHTSPEAGVTSDAAESTLKKKKPDKPNHTKMATNIKPLGTRVLVKRIENEEQKTDGGIFLPDTAKEKPQEAEVIALGTGKNDEGEIIEFSVKVGDKVLISKYGGTEVKLDGEEHLILNESDILGIIEK